MEGTEIKTIHFAKLDPISIHISDLYIAQNQLHRINENLDHLLLQKHVTKYLPWYSFLSVIILLLLSFCFCQYCCKCNPLTLCFQWLTRRSNHHHFNSCIKIFNTCHSRNSYHGSTPALHLKQLQGNNASTSDLEDEQSQTLPTQRSTRLSHKTAATREHWPK